MEVKQQNKGNQENTGKNIIGKDIAQTSGRVTPSSTDINPLQIFTNTSSSLLNLSLQIWF